LKLILQELIAARNSFFTSSDTESVCGGISKARFLALSQRLHHRFPLCVHVPYLIGQATDLQKMSTSYGNEQHGSDSHGPVTESHFSRVLPTIRSEASLFQR
jgi:hypothetical protein